MERPRCSQAAFPTSKRVEGQLKEIEDKAARKKEEVRFWNLQCVKSLIHDGVPFRLSHCSNNSKLYKRPALLSHRKVRCLIDYSDVNTSPTR